MIGMLVCIWLGWLIHKHEETVCSILKKIINFFKGY